MFAIGFDLVRDTEAAHLKRVAQAYAETNTVLNRYGFARVRGSVYVSQQHSLSGTLAINALKALPWLPTCARDVRALKVEHWSDLTNLMKS